MLGIIVQGQKGKTMRLINADVLFENLDGMMAVSPTGYIHGDTVADMIGDAPTVEAIPIEWLKNWNPKEWNDTGYQVMRRIIDDWEKRNEID